MQIRAASTHENGSTLPSRIVAALYDGALGARAGANINRPINP